MKSARSTRSKPEPEVAALVDNLFRHNWGQLVATLTRILGDVDLAEEVVQEAFVKALRTWPYRGVPESPGGWLITAARNRALDKLRHQGRVRQKQQLVTQALRRLAGTGPSLSKEVADDQLRLLFLCGSPELSADARLPLTLKLLGGFSNAEIARALLIRPATAAQRIVRAKHRLRSRAPDFQLSAHRVSETLEAVLKVVYLMFNEGYAASGGDHLVRLDLCREAIRLGGLLANHPLTRSPACDALLALMLLQAARLPARVDPDGHLVRMEAQNRASWDQASLAEGFRRLGTATRGSVVSEYHLQAAIAAEHAAAPTYEATAWDRIVALYDELLDMTDSPLVALNRAVAVARHQGPAVALEEVERISGAAELANYYLLPATRGQLLLELGRPDEAVPCLERALRLPCSAPERRLVRARLEKAKAALSGGS